VLFRVLADLVVVVHLLFLLFVVVGALLVLKWPRLAWIHVPAAVWGAMIEFGGWICPLTPLENRLRALGGGAGYSGGFIEHYVMPIVYPSALTRELQILLGTTVLLLNLFLYGWLIWRRRHRGTDE
jgi:hypothetical protein